jgi:hypothetical protein
MVEGDQTRDESEVLADRLRWAADSLTIEFDQVSRADAERLIFDVAREYLSEAKVAQFVPTFATRRARQLLRDRQAAGTALVEPFIGAPSNGLIDLTASDIEVIRDDDPIGAESTDLVEGPPATVATQRERGPAPAPFRSPSEYATEARRLLERAKVLRATAPTPAGPGDC